MLYAPYLTLCHILLPGTFSRVSINDRNVADLPVLRVALPRPVARKLLATAR
jgi:hypothetical protein